jgi:hypothetical protein
MKKLRFVLLFVVSLLFAQASGVESTLLHVLESWNRANNERDIGALSRLYAPSLVYYRSKVSKRRALQDKERFFRKYPGFAQTSEITDYVRVSPGLYRLIFTKRVSLFRGGERKNYPSYLVVDVAGSRPLIREEGDRITDANLAKKSRLPLYTFKGTYTLRGRIEEVHTYGPPGFGEDPAHDRKQIAYVLKLDRPIKVVADGSDDLNFTTTTSEIQLVIHDFERFKRLKRAHRTLTVSGTFFSAHTAHHIRDLLLDVTTMR